MNIGRLLKIFLPTLIGIFLVSVCVSALGQAKAGNYENNCNTGQYNLYGDWNNNCYPSPSPSPRTSPSPSPKTSPSPKPCEDNKDDHDYKDKEKHDYNHNISISRFFDVYAGSDYEHPKPSKSPCPTPSPSTPPQGGGGGENNPGPGGSGSSCPNDRLGKVTQVWFSDITSTSFKVHWSTKAEDKGYHIAYGLKPNEWLWGVTVGAVNEVTLNNLPKSTQIWVSVIPLDGNGCAGNAGDPWTVGELAATGNVKDSVIFLSGFALIILGLWQAQKVLRKREIAS